MAKGQNASRSSQNKDLWKPGPCSSWVHSPENKRLDRRTKRHVEKQALKSDDQRRSTDEAGHE